MQKAGLIYFLHRASVNQGLCLRLFCSERTCSALARAATNSGTVVLSERPHTPDAASTGKSMLLSDDTFLGLFFSWPFRDFLSQPTLFWQIAGGLFDVQVGERIHKLVLDAYSQTIVLRPRFERLCSINPKFPDDVFRVRVSNMPQRCVFLQFRVFPSRARGGLPTQYEGEKRGGIAYLTDSNSSSKKIFRPALVQVVMFG